MEGSSEEKEVQNMIQTAIMEELIRLRIIQDTLAYSRTICSFEPAKSENFEGETKLKYNKISPIREAETPQMNEKAFDFEEEKRQRPTDTNSYPHSVHGIIIIKESENSVPKWGSGALVAPNIVLTAAHNVYDDQKPIRKRYPCIKFVPGANKDNAPFGEIDIEDVFAPEEYISHNAGGNEVSGLIEHDYALVTLKKPIGNETGYFGLHAVAAEHSRSLKDKEVYVVGYPEVDMKAEGQIRFEQWGEKGRIIEFESKKGVIHYQIPNYSGLSGSVVFYKKEKNQFYVVGVHIGENKASWLTKEKMLQLYQRLEQSTRDKHENLLRSRNSDCVIKKLELSNKKLTPTRMNILLSYRLNSLEEVKLSKCAIDDFLLEEISVNSDWKNLRKLDLSSNKIGNKGCQVLASTKAWKNLKSVILQENTIGEEGIHEIVKKKPWPNLEEINFSQNSLPNEAALILARNSTWEHLKILILSQNYIEPKGAFALASNTTWTKLEKLDLSDNWIAEKDWQNWEALWTQSNKKIVPDTIVTSSNTMWNNITILNLSGNNIGSGGAIAIGKSIILKNLKVLSLNGCHLGDKGACAIASNTTWTKLNRLALSSNKIGNSGAAAIGKNTALKYLEGLFLQFNEIGDDGVVVLASNVTWGHLERLNLTANRVGDEGAAAIARNVTWTNLESLQLSNNQIGDKGALAIANSRWWKNLAVLELTINKISDQGGIAIGRNTSWKLLQVLHLGQNEITWKTFVEIARNESWNDIQSIHLSRLKALTIERKNALSSITLHKSKSVFNFIY